MIALIGKLNDDGKTVTYTVLRNNAHWAFSMLTSEYATARKVNNLIKRGYIAWLGESIGECNYIPNTEGNHVELLNDYTSRHIQHKHKIDKVFLFRDNKWVELSISEIN